MSKIGTQTCDRCSTTAPDALIDEAYLVDDPTAATGSLCPACARADDPAHIPGSWLLLWG